MIKELNKYHYHFSDHSLGQQLEGLIALCQTYHIGWAIQSLQAIADDYARLKQFFQSGYPDNERNEVYRRLQRRTKRVTHQLILNCYEKDNISFQQAAIHSRSQEFSLATVCDTLLGFDQAIAMASLNVSEEEDASAIYVNQFKYRRIVFDWLYTSGPFSSDDSRMLVETVLSPLISRTDALLIVSAMMLSMQTLFDARKFDALCRICGETTDTEVRIRSLIAIVFSLPDTDNMKINYDIFSSSMHALFEREDIQQELIELQIQVLMSMKTEENEKEIEQNIMPYLKENAINIQRDMESDGLNTDIDFILNPDKEESAMNDVEKAVERIRDMQKQGADVFFGGFSHAKRFAFFYTLCNWFCPFYMEHPGINHKKLEKIPLNFIEKLICDQPFCNSDRYSFLLSFASVVDQLPKELLNMMTKGEVAPAFTVKNSEQDAAYLRRLYLQDLYRFYNLYPSKNDFINPLASEVRACFTADTIICDFFSEEQRIKLARLYIKYGQYDDFDHLYMSYFKNGNPKILRLSALNAIKQGDLDEAAYLLSRAIEADPDDMKSHEMLGVILFDCQNYKEALLELALSYNDNPTDTLAYKYAVSLIYNGDADEAMKILFRLYFEHDDIDDYKRGISLGYYAQGKYEDSLRMIDSLETEPDADMRIFKAFVLYMAGRTADSAEELRHVMKVYLLNREDVYKRLSDNPLLCSAVKAEANNLTILLDIAAE